MTDVDENNTEIHGLGSDDKTYKIIVSISSTDVNRSSELVS